MDENPNRDSPALHHHSFASRSGARPSTIRRPAETSRLTRLILPWPQIPHTCTEPDNRRLPITSHRRGHRHRPPFLAVRCLTTATTTDVRSPLPPRSGLVQQKDETPGSNVSHRHADLPAEACTRSTTPSCPSRRRRRPSWSRSLDVIPSRASWKRHQA